MNWQHDSALIGGAWTPAPNTCPVENPATEKIIGTAALCDESMVERAVAAARDALPAWESRTPEDRADVLDAFARELRFRREDLTDVTVAEVGVSVTNARAWHVDLAIEFIDSAAANARSYPFEKEVGNSLLIRRAAGVVGCITPWNYPIYQLAAKVGPALAAGCTVVVKPAELAPLSSYLVADAAMAAGVPAGVFNLVPGKGTTVGAAIAAHPDVDLVSFTGSTQVGRQVAQSAAANLTRVCLELGGKSSSIVLDDADFRTAVEGTVDSSMLNSGQTCDAWTRLLVPSARYEEALEIAGEHCDRLTVGDPKSEDTDLGPLISAAQRTGVVESIDGAVSRGARLVTGGSHRPDGLGVGHFVSPTVLADLDPTDPASQNEIFGPVLVVHPFENVDEAVEIANGTPYGLSGGVWAATAERALEVTRRLDTGQVYVNGADFNREAPFGGWKQSGIGRELGAVGLEEYTELTSVQR